MHYTSCNYRQNLFLFVHSYFIVFSITTASKLTQTLSLTSLHFSTTFAQCVRLFLSIEDPFEIGYDVGHVLREDTAKRLRSEFQRAYVILSGGAGTEIVGDNALNMLLEIWIDPKIESDRIKAEEKEAIEKQDLLRQQQKSLRNYSDCHLDHIYQKEKKDGNDEDQVDEEDKDKKVKKEKKKKDKKEKQ